MALCSPPFPWFFGPKWKKDVPIWDYFGFSHALHFLPMVFRNSFSLRIITGPLALQAAHTDAHCKNYRQLPPAAISLAVFFAYTFLTSSKILKTKKTACQNKMSIMFYIRQWMVDNSRTNTMMTPYPKTVRRVLCSVQINVKWLTIRGALLKAKCGLPEPDFLHPAVPLSFLTWWLLGDVKKN